MRQEPPSSPRRLRGGLAGRRGIRWSSKTLRTGSRWRLWYLPTRPPGSKGLAVFKPGGYSVIRVGGNLGYYEEVRIIPTGSRSELGCSSVLDRGQVNFGEFPFHALG